MWGYVITLIIGAAIPLITIWFQSKEKEKYFELERKEKFKLVAIEKRLEAHQKAFLLWAKMIEFVHKPDERKIKILIDALILE
jgi:hypothetical protein